MPVRPIIVTEESEDDILNPIEDMIPGPRSQEERRQRHESDYMDMSLTEHHVKGAGILASRRDLDLPLQEFAAGCNLLQAAAQGDVKSIEAFLKENPSHVNFRDYDRRTALHVASSEGHLTVVIFLVEKGAKIHRSDRWGGSPLDDAHRHQQVEVARYLRSKGATTGSLNQTTNFITAAANGDLEEVELLVDSIKDINDGDYDKRTALHLACGEGHVKVVEFLLNHGANPNAEDRWGGRPLEDAMRNQHTACITVLKRFGAQPGTHDQQSNHSAERPDDPNLRVGFRELEMIERIGGGAFGEIYKCRWRGTLVAAKIIKTAKIRQEWLAKHAMNQENGDDAADMLDEAAGMEERKEEALADFRQEVSVLRTLRHPNICLLLAYSTTEDKEVMISELMRCSLLDIFKAHMIHGTRMKHKTQIAYAKQLAQGMNYLHTCKPPVIHRDLKPANLLIDHSGGLKISDFGLSKIRPDHEQPTESYRMTGETGSYRFMAPEVFRNEDYDETVDVYSYGMILYYLLSGKPPWWNLNGLKAAQNAALEAERPIIPREWDARLADLLQRCWDENRRARPHFKEIIEILEAYSQDKFKSNPNMVIEAPLPPSSKKQGCACVIL